MSLQGAVLVLLALGAFAGSGGAQERPLSFGVLNQQSPALTAERWNPILHYVSARSGVPLQLRMGPTVQETDAMMGRGEFDFVFTNHNFQSEFDSVGYRVIARWGGDPIHGVIAVPEDSPIQSLKQLDGRRVAFPSADAFVAYAVPRGRAEASRAWSWRRSSRATRRARWPSSRHGGSTPRPSTRASSASTRSARSCACGRSSSPRDTRTSP